MKKICYLTAVIAVFVLTLFSCGKEDSIDPIEEKNTIVGDWQVLRSESIDKDFDQTTKDTVHFIQHKFRLRCG